MNYLLDLYSESTCSHTEEKQNERRFIFAVIAALLLHIGMFIAAGMTDLLNYKRPDEIKIINVQIHQEESAIPPKTEQSPAQHKQTMAKQVQQTKTPAKAKPADTKPVQQSKPRTQTNDRKIKDSIPKNTDNTKEEIRQTQNKTIQTETKQSTHTETPARPAAKTQSPAAEQVKTAEPVQPDIFEQMTKAADTHAAETKRQWTDSHQRQTQPAAADDDDIREAIQNISAAAASPKGTDGQPGKTAAADNETAPDSNNIRWTSGTSRRLVSSGDIEPPEEIALRGLKTSITIRFEVFDNGLIGRTEIISSSGESEWDNDVAQQFKSKYKFEQGSGKAMGTIAINIGY